MYHPLFTAVSKLAYDQCATVKGGALDSLSPHYPPPLPTIETLVLAVLINLHQMDAKYSALFQEIMKHLHQEIFTNDPTFNNVIAFW